MNLEKLLSILTTGNLFFTQVSSLQRDDPYEGEYTKADILRSHELTNDPAFLEAFAKKYVEENEAPEMLLAEAINRVKYLVDPKELRQKAFVTAKSGYVSCWHLNNDESAGLWKLYSNMDAGVAIRTNISNLKKSLSRVERIIYSGTVEYLDYSNTYLYSTAPTHSNLFSKRHNFAHEAEYRVAFFSFPEFSEPQTLDILDENPPGISIPCDLNDLIESIIISPSCPPWAAVAIGETVSTLLPNASVCRSDLLTSPPYDPTPDA